MGTAYVALFNHALARRHGGQFVLRIEDTDRQRSHPASERMIFDALRWLGLDWDEGPDVGGPFGPYRQSERSAIYQEHAATPRPSAAPPTLASARRSGWPRCARSRRPGRPRSWATTASAAGSTRRRRPRAAAAGESHVIRLAMPEDPSMVVTDLLRGEVRFERPQMDDQVLLKSDGFPTYHLANVVDDHLMGITHVVRAEEWLSSLPKHVQLYRAFGWELPVFCHLPLLRNADKSKISKRKNPVSLNHYRRAGFLPEAMVNFLALMSFSMPDGREEFTLAEFVREFELERISLGGPVFDLEKLTWLNGRYLRRLSTGRAHRPAARPPPVRRLPGRGAPALPRARRHPRGLLRLRLVLLRGRGGLRRRRACGPWSRRTAPRPRWPRPCGTLLEKAIDPLLEWNAAGGGGGAPGLRGGGRLASQGPLHDRPAGRDRPRGHPAALRDPGRARQGDLPAPAAPRRPRRCSRRSRRLLERKEPHRLSDDKSRSCRTRSEAESRDFIREIVADRPAERHATRRSSPASRPSPTATSTSATPSRSA